MSELHLRPDLMVEALKRCPRLWTLFDEIAVIINPFAGSLRRRSSVRKINRSLENVIGEIPESISEKQGEISVHCTEYSGHAMEITKTVLSKAKAKAKAKEEAEVPDKGNISRGRVLFISAGGDGTAQEISSALVTEYRDRASDSKKNDRGVSVVFRMPMGTGNDGLDAATVESALTILQGEVKIVWEDGLEIRTTNHPCLYGFNIASIGLDGWVVHLSNKMKRFFPGSFYTIMTDIATLFYEKIVGVHPWEVLRKTIKPKTALRGSENPKEEEITIRGTYLLMAFGVSGYRTYGGNKLILPNANNVCMVKSMGMLRKIAIKNTFYTGAHTELPEAVLFKADEIEVRYGGRIPLQYDGEVLWLEMQDFPLAIRRRPAILPRLVPKYELPEGEPET